MTCIFSLTPSLPLSLTIFSLALSHSVSHSSLSLSLSDLSLYFRIRVCKPRTVCIFSSFAFESPIKKILNPSQTTRPIRHSTKSSPDQSTGQNGRKWIVFYSHRFHSGWIFCAQTRAEPDRWSPLVVGNNDIVDGLRCQ